MGESMRGRTCRGGDVEGEDAIVFCFGQEYK